MKIEKIKDLKNKLIFNLEGQGHTFCNLLKDELNETKGVVSAGYNISHPLIGIPKMIIDTDDSITPKDALDKALKNLKKKSSEAQKLIDKEL